MSIHDQQMSVHDRQMLVHNQQMPISDQQMSVNNQQMPISDQQIRSYFIMLGLNYSGQREKVLIPRVRQTALLRHGDPITSASIASLTVHNFFSVVDAGIQPNTDREAS